MTKLFRYLLAFGLFCLSVGGPVSHARETVDISQDIVAFFKQTELDYSATEIVTVDLPYTVRFSRDVVKAVVSSDVERLSAVVEAVQSEAFSNPEDRAAITNFAQTLVAAMQADQTRDGNAALVAALDATLLHESWFLRSISGSLLSHAYLTRNDFLVSAGHVEDAMNAIPSELSLKTTYARSLASEVAMALHGVQGNPTFMLEAARIQGETKRQLGESLNRYELMTNFVYALNRDRDFSGAAKIANLLLEEPKPDNTVPGLSETYMAETFNMLGQYRRALALSETAISEAEHPVIAQRARRPNLIALAGLGDAATARARMTEWGWNATYDDLMTVTRNDAVVYANALLAMHRGETQISIDLMKRWADLQINSVHTANSNGMTSLLSNLENTRERQSEREGALQREAELKAIQLDQQNRLNRQLWILIGGLTLAFNLLLAFLRYREKNNAKVRGLQEEALSAEKMKTEFLGVINHELRTPLNGIIGISDAMIHHAEDPTSRAQAAAVQQSGQLLFDLLDSLITMSTIEGNRLTLDKEPVALPRLIADEANSWRSAAEEKGLTFTHFVAADAAPKVIGDATRIRQCLRYLLSNAVRFTHKGRVHLHVSAEQIEGDLAVTMTVADTGQGISDEVQERLFKPFLQADATMTRKYGGAGLSLAIARKLAHMMKGDLVVNSREGRGSEFTFSLRLPVAVAAPQTRASIEPVAPRSRPALATKVTQPDAFDDVDAPEEIIDLMLSHPLLQDAGDRREGSDGRAADRQNAVG